jgi:hypothetical protein
MVRIVVVFMFLLTVVMSLPSFGASVFEGVWTVEDTAGNEFEIALSSNGTAKSNLRPGTRRGRCHNVGDRMDYEDSEIGKPIPTPGVPTARSAEWTASRQLEGAENKVMRLVRFRSYINRLYRYK